MRRRHDYSLADINSRQHSGSSTWQPWLRVAQSYLDGASPPRLWKSNPLGLHPCLLSIKLNLFAVISLSLSLFSLFMLNCRLDVYTQADKWVMMFVWLSLSLSLSLPIQLVWSEAHFIKLMHTHTHSLSFNLFPFFICLLNASAYEVQTCK